MKKLLVIGASGLIGRHVAQALLGTPLFEAEGYNVVAVQNRLTSVAKIWARDRSTVGTGSF